MAWFRIYSLGPSGNIEISQPIKAESREQAIALSGRAKDHIEDVKVDYFGGLKKLFEKTFPLIDQIVILSALASKVASGQTFGIAVKQTVKHDKIKVSAEELEQCETPSQYLSKLRFDDTVVLIADAGDNSGKLASSLFRASKSLQERMAAQKEFGKAFRQGISYALIGVAFMILIPLSAGTSMDDMINVQKMPLRMNALSHLIMLLHTFYTEYYMLIFAAFGAIFYFRQKIWESTRTLPVLSYVNERNKVSRGIDFLASYRLLASSGYNAPQSFAFLEGLSKGLTSKLYAEGVVSLNQGRALSEVFENPEWPEIIHQNLSGFEEQAIEGREIILENLNEALKTYYLIYSEKISRACQTFGYCLMVFAILLLALGFYFPLMNISSSLKQM